MLLSRGLCPNGDIKLMMKLVTVQALDRVSVLEVATAEVRAEGAEHEARMDAVSRDLRALTKSYHKMRTDLADFQARVNFDNHDYGSDNGSWHFNFF
jgi:hypothetical protein